MGRVSVINTCGCLIQILGLSDLDPECDPLVDDASTCCARQIMSQLNQPVLCCCNSFKCDCKYGSCRKGDLKIHVSTFKRELFILSVPTKYADDKRVSDQGKLLSDVLPVSIPGRFHQHIKHNESTRAHEHAKLVTNEPSFLRLQSNNYHRYHKCHHSTYDATVPRKHEHFSKETKQSDLRAIATMTDLTGEIKSLDAVS